MIFSSVLKTRLERFLENVGNALDLELAILGDADQIYVKSKHFDENWLLSEVIRQTITFTPIRCVDCSLKLAIRAFDSGLSKERETNLIALLRENIETMILLENEAQGLAQEVLEKYEELNLLYDLISDLSLLFDEKKISRLTLEKAMRVLNVGCGAIFLQEEESGDLSLIYYAKREGVQGFRKPERLKDFAQKAMRHGKEFLIDDKQKLPKWFFENLENKDLWSLLIVPIQAHDKIMGSMVLVGKIGDDTFQSGDIKLAEAISGYAGITINSNRLVEQMRIAEALQHEMKLARNIQQSLLPRSLPDTKYFEVAGVCEPAADVGGDYFSVNQLSDTVWEFVIADVSGHGIGAAMTMASLRSILRSESRLRNKIDEIVQNANLLLCQDTEETGMYATLFLARLDGETGVLTYSNAGHQVPLLWRQENQNFELLDQGGLPVGMFADEKYVQNQVTLKQGDTIVMFTDGVTEARSQNGELFGEQRLRSVTKEKTEKSADEILNNILQEVRKFQHSDLQRDDITVVVVKRK